MRPFLLCCLTLVAGSALLAGPAVADGWAPWYRDQRPSFSPSPNSLYFRWEHRGDRDHRRFDRWSDHRHDRRFDRRRERDGFGLWWGRPPGWQQDYIVRDRWGRKLGVVEPKPFHPGYVLRDRSGRVVGTVEPRYRRY